MDKKDVLELLDVAKAYRRYVDAIPKDVQLPAMPGHDRDWSDGVIDRFEKRALSSQPQKGE